MRRLSSPAVAPLAALALARARRRARADVTPRDPRRRPRRPPRAHPPGGHREPHPRLPRPGRRSGRCATARWHAACTHVRDGRIGYGGLVAAAAPRPGHRHHAARAPAAALGVRHATPARRGWDLPYRRIRTRRLLGRGQRLALLQPLPQQGAGRLPLVAPGQRREQLRAAARLPGAVRVLRSSPATTTRQVRHRGAGIFLHVNGRGATAGCVSAPRWFLRRMMWRLDPAQVPGHGGRPMSPKRGEEVRVEVDGPHPDARPTSTRCSTRAPAPPRARCSTTTPRSRRCCCRCSRTARSPGSAGRTASSGDRFFEKNAPAGTPRWVRTADVPDDRARAARAGTATGSSSRSSTTSPPSPGGQPRRARAARAPVDGRPSRASRAAPTGS